MTKLDSIEKQHVILKRDLLQVQQKFGYPYQRSNDDFSTQLGHMEDKLVKESKDHLNKLGHAIDYLLEDKVQTYETRACQEMVNTMIENKERPFSGQTIINRERREHRERCCLFLILPIVILICACLITLSGPKQNVKL
jgi:hypothetical protein